MSGDKQFIRGADNTQIIGNNNCVNKTMVIANQQPLTHSLIHELLDIVYSLPDSEDDSYPLRNPVQIRTKLLSNDARRYISIIDNHVEEYVRVDHVMKDYANSEVIVKKLRDMFLKVAEFDKKGKPRLGNGDSQLDKIASSLFETIVTDSKFEANRHPRENIEHFCIALVAYGVSKCKILEAPGV